MPTRSTPSFRICTIVCVIWKEKAFKESKKSAKFIMGQKSSHHALVAKFNTVLKRVVLEDYIHMKFKIYPKQEDVAVVCDDNDNDANDDAKINSSLQVTNELLDSDSELETVTARYFDSCPHPSDGNSIIQGNILLYFSKEMTEWVASNKSTTTTTNALPPLPFPYLFKFSTETIILTTKDEITPDQIYIEWLRWRQDNLNMFTQKYGSTGALDGCGHQNFGDLNVISDHTTRSSIADIFNFFMNIDDETNTSCIHQCRVFLKNGQEMTITLWPSAKADNRTCRVTCTLQSEIHFIGKRLRRVWDETALHFTPLYNHTHILLFRFSVYPIPIN